MPVVRRVAERLSNGRDMVGKIRLLDRGVPPHRLHQLVFREQPSRILGEHHQQVERLGRQRYQLPMLQELALNRHQRGSANRKRDEEGTGSTGNDGPTPGRAQAPRPGRPGTCPDPEGLKQDQKANQWISKTSFRDV